MNWSTLTVTLYGLRQLHTYICQSYTKTITTKYVGLVLNIATFRRRKAALQWELTIKTNTMYVSSYTYPLPIHCGTIQFPLLSANDMPSSVLTQHSSAVVGPETKSPFSGQPGSL